MIDPGKLLDSDIGRLLTWRKEEIGELVAWTQTAILVKFPSSVQPLLCRPEELFFIKED
jgi:hypothetical protein